jgi:Flp pilus assembly pilin Flp
LHVSSRTSRAPRPSSGLIAAGIAVAIITAVNAVGTDLSGLFGRISAKLTAAGT